MVLKSISKIKVPSPSILCSCVNVYVSVWFIWVRKEKKGKWLGRGFPRETSINLTLYTDYTAQALHILCRV